MAGDFVGRAEELAALVRVAESVIGGRRATALVTGPPGIGKSRLLDEVARLVEGRVPVLAVRGYEPEQSVGFAAARNVLAQLAGTPGEPVLGSLLRAAGEPSRRAHATAMQLRLFEAAHRSQRALGPVLVIVDDAQWVDPASAALCHYLLRATESPDPPVGLIIGGRPGPTTRSMWDAARRLDPSGGARVELAGLSREDAVALAEVIAPDLDFAARARAWERTAGSPFWLARLLRGGSRLPAEELIGLGPDEDAMLTLLACAARPIPEGELPSILEWEDRRARMTVAALGDAGLVTHERAGEVRIAHDLLREAVAARLSPEQIRAVHARVGAWLATRSDELQDLSEAIEHLRAGNRRVTDVALRLATARGRRLLGEPGLLRLDQIAAHCEPDEAACRALQAAVATLAVELGNHERALARWTSLLEVVRGEDRGRAALGAARAALELGLRDEAWSYLDGAERDSRREPLRVGIAATRSAVMRYLDHDPAAARAFAAEALHVSRRLSASPGGKSADARAAHIQALLAATDAALMNDDPEEMLRLADELADRTAASHPRTHIDALTQGALARRFLGRNLDAEHRLARAWELARAQVMPQAILEVGALRGVVLLTLGRLDEADAVSRELAALDRRLEEFRPARAFSHVLPHLIEASRGDWRRAVEGLGQAARREPDPHYRLHGHLERAVALARIEPGRRADAVRTTVAAARRDADTAGCDRCRREVLARGAEALGRIGDNDDARRWLSDDQLAGDDRGDVAMRWWIERGRAATLDGADAARSLGELKQMATAQGMALEAVWCELDLARALLRVDRAGAAAAARRAGEAALQMGARTEQQVAERLLRDLGVRTWRRGAATPSARPQLTEREREVVDLVRRGASNPEVASALFLSRKTVERHLSNAMAKLGVRNRAELAAAAPAPDDDSKVEGVPR